MKGEGKVVKIDKSEIRKRKYHWGHQAQGQWLSGGVDWGSGRMFLVTVHDTSAEILTGYHETLDFSEDHHKCLQHLPDDTPNSLSITQSRLCKRLQGLPRKQNRY